MQSWFTFELDGEVCRVEETDTQATLASFLAQFDLSGRTTSNPDPWNGGHLVVLGDIEGDRRRFRATDASLLLLPMVAGRQVWTARGIENAEPDHPVNLALQHGHFECGQERIGSIRALLFEGYYRPDLRRQGQVNDQFDAVVTRTHNAPALREAAAQVFASTEQLRHEAAQKAEKEGEERSVWSGSRDIFGDRFTKSLFRLKEKTPLSYVDASKRRFHRPETIVELLKLKREYPDASFIAGGTDLATRAGEVEWANLISLEAVRELNTFHRTEEAWEIGAAVPLTRIAEQIGRECQPFNKILRRFASRPIRNRATLGGYLASPWAGSQLTPLLMALNARIILLSEEAERDAPITQFFTENGETILAPNEVIRSIVIPRYTETALASRGIAATICNAYTVAPRRNLSQSWVTGAFAIDLRGSTIAKARIAYAGIEASPRRMREAEETLTGKAWEADTVHEMLPILNEKLKATDGPEQGYRKQLGVMLFQKFLSQHPDAKSLKPEELSSASEFANLNPPFFDALPG
ncbi:MAG: FAD binding domain-containing protein [Verrucomicrobiota bacterium]